MKLNYQFSTTFQDLDLNLEELLGKYAARDYHYKNLVEYEILNYSICVPDHLNTAINHDGYDFIAYESNGQSGYSSAPLAVTISNQPLVKAAFPTKADQLAFLKRMAEIMKRQLRIKEVAETTLDGCQAIILEEKMEVIGRQTHAILISNQFLTQISVTIRGNFINAEELTEMIIQSFKVNSTPSPQIGFLSSRMKAMQMIELEDNLCLSTPIQYMTPSHTERKGIEDKALECRFDCSQKDVVFLGYREVEAFLFSSPNHVVHQLVA
ncbi:MAG: hypothetical protein IJD87_02150 [Turicibacter sp.]|nr:hypothetical protein [Turicibacter sp.]